MLDYVIKFNDSYKINLSKFLLYKIYNNSNFKIQNFKIKIKF